MRSLSFLILFLAGAWCVPGFAGAAELPATPVGDHAGPSRPGPGGPASGAGGIVATGSMGDSGSSESGDAEIVRLLGMNVSGPKERLEYVQECERAVARYSQTKLKAEIYRRIGDIYFTLNQFPAMETWYRRALAIDASLKKSTSIGFRLQGYSRIKLSRFGKLAALLVLAGVLGVILVHGVMSYRLIDWRFCIRKLSVCLLIYCLLVGIVFWVDGLAAAKWLLSLSAPEAGKLSIVQPVIPLSMVDGSSAGRAAQILLFGFVPVLVAVFYTSFRRPRSRRFLSVIVLLAFGSLWTHFYFAQVYGPVQDGDGFVRHGRFYLRGEPEELLIRDLPKALRANPDLLKSDNDDLEEFMKVHYPDGVKQK